MTANANALAEVPVHDFARAKYIVSFGADFLDGSWVSPVETQHGFAEAHGLDWVDLQQLL